MNLYLVVPNIKTYRLSYITMSCVFRRLRAHNELMKTKKQKNDRIVRKFVEHLTTKRLFKAKQAAQEKQMQSVLARDVINSFRLYKCKQRVIFILLWKRMVLLWKRMVAKALLLHKEG